MMYIYIIIYIVVSKRFASLVLSNSSSCCHTPMSRYSTCMHQCNYMYVYVCVSCVRVCGWGENVRQRPASIRKLRVQAEPYQKRDQESKISSPPKAIINLLSGDGFVYMN